ncbi:MAG: biopolymer transporter ExbD, partial [Bdellovibrionales bacterium]|nr:biopolymer transporter ExbD [Bdellovibrionales bacterium]
MGSSLGSNDDEPIATINVTPFVDIILVVLIIFMVTTPLIMQPSIKIQLPKAASGEESNPSTLNVSIDVTGSIQVNGKASDESSLAESARKVLSENPEVQAIIAADKDVAHGKVIGVIDVIKSAGILKF